MRDIDNSPDQDYTRSAADPPPYSGPGSYRAEPTYVGAPQPTATVIQRPAIVVAQNNYLAPNPQPYYCRSCNQQIVTKVEKVNTMKTHLFAALFCVTGYVTLACNFLDFDVFF